jgi:hypothetical protein
VLARYYPKTLQKKHAWVRERDPDYEDVTHARLGTDIGRVGRVRSIFAAGDKSSPQDGDIIPVFRPPHGRQQITVKPHLVGAANELGQQRELDRRQVYGLTVERHLPVGHVHEQRPGLVGCLIHQPWGDGAVATKYRVNPCLQRAPAKGLGEVIVRAQVEPGHHALFVVTRSDDDDGHIGQATQLAQHFQPIHIG